MIRHPRVVAAVVLFLIAAGGLWLRFYLAPQTAHADTNAVRSWMESSVKLGLAVSYRQQVSTGWMPSYPPLAILMLEVSGYMYKLFVSSSYVVIDPAHMIFAKIPSIFADIVTGILLFFIVKRMRSLSAGLLAAAIYIFHPAVLFDSVVWGQTDTLYTVFLVGAVWAYISGRPVLGAVIALLSCLVKVQALLLLPLFLFLVPFNRRVITVTLGLWIAILLTFSLPFLIGGTFPEMIATYVPRNVLHESHAAWQAFNGWCLLLWPHGWDIPGTTKIFGVLTYDQAGLLAFGGLYLMILFVFRRSLRGNLAKPLHTEIFFCTLTLLTFSAFMVGTQMHERYLFHFLALALPLAFLNWRYAVLYGVVSL